MSTSGTVRADERLWLYSLIVLGGAVAFGATFACFSDAPATFLEVLLGAAALGVLLAYPELALALYVVIGDVKGDDRVASLLPVDLTLALGAVLLAGIGLNCLRKKRAAAMPPVYLLFVALIAVMITSLSYTPVFSAGLEKLCRFLTVTGIVIVAPFFVLGTPQAMKRFLAGFGIVAFAICAWSLSGLSGAARLATPSDNTIGLGHIACELILLIWFAVIPRYRFPKRLAAYALLGVPAVAMIGSGSRGPLIACAIVILLSPVFHRKLLLDLACIAGLGLAAIPFVKIPDSAIDYLGTLVRGQSVGSVLDFRSDLLDYGWKLLQRHPLIGTGIQGFRYYSPNPELYKWPHNIFLEIACELGIPAALIACIIFGSAVLEAARQLKHVVATNFVLSQVAAALLFAGLINATNTGDINSDRATWLFVSLIFVTRTFRRVPIERREAALAPAHPVAA
ncbi:MAG TPA: O-antigen ligase family protein [Candidatus Baltobacteraceae bacterium]|nr:O-antigen ligase family protein [Candidatus Baltobacteraceae bacterium]